MIIFGTAPYHRVLGRMRAACGRCGNVADHVIVKRGTKLSLFFIPLIPVSGRHQLECTICGQAARLTAEEAERLVRSGDPQV